MRFVNSLTSPWCRWAFKCFRCTELSRNMNLRTVRGNNCGRKRTHFARRWGLRVLRVTRQETGRVVPGLGQRIAADDPSADGAESQLGRAVDVEFFHDAGA